MRFPNRFLNVYQPLYNGYTASNAFIFVVLKHLADWSSVVQKSSHFTLYLSKYDLSVCIVFCRPAFNVVRHILWGFFRRPSMNLINFRRLVELYHMNAVGVAGSIELIIVKCIH